jgi:TP901 family phage tail tape measure protein
VAAGGNQLNAVLVFGGDAKGAVAAINTLNGRLNELTRKIGSTSRQTGAATGIMAGSKGFGGLGAVIKGVLGTAQRFVDGFRLVTQGLMSAGRALTFFISLPLAMFLRQGFQAAVDFEEQMVKVAKVTDLPNYAKSGNDLKTLTAGLREIARQAPTSHTQLGMMAEQAGQLGIKSAKGITTFVRWMEILASSTNITADEVVKTMGKIAVAFGWNIDESADNIIRLSNVLNELENNTAATAGEIADALFRFAPIANQLNIAAADAAALAAALISVGVSAESSGTRLGTMYVKLTQNTEEFAKLAAGTEKYAEASDVTNAINEDAVQVLQDLIEMMGNTDDRAGKLAAAFDLVGLRGGRALGALAAGHANLGEAMNIARMEWEEASSLVKEYNRQLESTQSHMSIMKNNVTDIAIELGDTLLPILNDFIELLIPAARRIVEFIKVTAATNPQLIYMAAGITAAVVAIGPLLFLFSQIFFGLTMVGLGLIKFVGVLYGAGQAIGTVLVGLASLNVWILALVGVLAVAAGGILKVLENMGKDVSGFFRGLAMKATAWGESLSANIANGLISGAVKFIAKALTAIANLIASFLEGHSPPDVGPLSHIDKWGETLMDTYLKGMASADFSILSKIGDTIGKIFATFELVGILGDKKQYKLLLQARQNLAKLLSIWNETGKISEKVLNDIVKHLRSAKEEVKELIKLELTMLGIEKALLALEQRRTDTQESYASQIDDIAGSGKSAEERVSLIRDAMRARNDELKAIAKEEKELEKQKTIAEEQLETQRAMIEAMQKQDDIQSKLVETLEDLASAIGGMAETDFEFGGLGGDEPPEPEDIFGEMAAPIIELELRIKSKEGLWDSFMAGLRGETTKAVITDEMLIDVPLSERRQQRAMDAGVQPKDIELFYTMNEIGLKINKTYTDITTTMSNLSDAISNVFGGGVELPPGAIEAWESVERVFKGIGLVLTLVFGPALKGLQIIWEGFKKAVAPAVDKLGESWDNLKSKFKESSAMRKLGAFFLMLGVVLGWLANIAVMFIGGFVFLFSMFVDYVLHAISFIMDYLAILLDDNLSFGEKLKAIWGIMWEYILANILTFRNNAIAFLGALWDYLKESAPRILGEVREAFITGFATLLARITMFADESKAKWDAWIESIKTKITIFFVSLGLRFIAGFFNLTNKIGEWIAERISDFDVFMETVKEGFSTKWEEIKTAIGISIDTIKENFRVWAEGLKTSFFEWAEGWLTAIKDGIDGGVSAVVGAFEGLVEKAIEAIQPLLNVIQKILNFVNNPPKMPKIKLPWSGDGDTTEDNSGGGDAEFATGGIVTSRMRAIVGEVPEAIIPLSKLPSLLNRINSYAGADGMGGGGMQVNLTFEIGSVDSAETADRLAEEVIRKVEESINNGMAFGVGYR